MRTMNKYRTVIVWLLIIALVASVSVGFLSMLF
jgi:hypothetical protein